MGVWVEQVVPRITNKTLDTELVREIRARVCAGLAGEVLEVGFGSGLNVPHYPAAVVRVAAVEPSDLGWRLAGERLAATSVPVQRSGLDGQALPFPDDSFDMAVMALVIHFVSDPTKAVVEMERVLRPGGTAAAYVWDYTKAGTPTAPLVAAMRDVGVPSPGPPSPQVTSR